MASRYGGITGTEQIANDYQNINIAFENVEADVDAKAAIVTDHINSTAAHAAEHITYSGSASGDNVKDAIDTIDERIDTIIQGGGPDKDAELVDIRTPDPSYTPSRTINVAGDMVRDMQAQFSAQLADKANKSDLNATNATVALKANQSDVTSALANKADRTYVDAQVSAVASGSPKGVYATLAELQTAFPTGNSNVYIVSSDGKWYYWSGSTWNAGGVYQSTAIGDDEVTPPKIYKDDYSVNLFNKNTITSGFYLNNSGTQVAAAGFCISDFISVTAGKRYNYYVIDPNGNNLTFQGCYYDSSKNFLGAFPANAQPATWTAPSGAAFVRLNMGLSKIDLTYFRLDEYLKYGLKWLTVSMDNLDSDVKTAIESTSKWVGKIANFLGDSITYGSGLAEGDRLSKRFSDLIKNDLSLSAANNYGAIGSKIGKVADGDGSFTQRYSAMAANADIVFVFGGTNDYGHNASNHPYSVPFGTFADRTDTTFYGALHVLCNGLITKYPNKPIVFITPTHRLAWNNGTTPGDDLVPNPDTNKNLRDYVKAIREVCEYYGVYVLDFYKDLNINPIVPVNKTNLMPDGLHPNAAGHRLMADAIIKFMERI